MRLWPSCPLTIYSNSCWVLRTESFWILTYLPIHSEISQGLGPNLNNYKLIYNIVTCSHTAWSWFYTSSQVSLCTKQNPILPSAQKKKMCFCTPAERNIWANPIPGGGGEWRTDKSLQVLNWRLAQTLKVTVDSFQIFLFPISTQKTFQILKHFQVSGGPLLCLVLFCFSVLVTFTLQ